MSVYFILQFLHLSVDCIDYFIKNITLSLVDRGDLFDQLCKMLKCFFFSNNNQNTLQLNRQQI